jgi:hypothetical protein
LPRNLLSLGDNAVRDLVRVLLALAALLALGPAAELCVGASCAGLGLGLRAAEQSADVYFTSTVRALVCHRPHDNPATTYESCTKSK